MPNAARSRSKKAVKKTAAKSAKKATLPKRIVEKKPYFELITAILSIPVLITLSILNINSLSKINATPTPTPEPKNVAPKGFFAAPVELQKGTLPSLSPNTSDCKKGIGPVDISSPQEGDTVKDNPVIINISYDDSEYCGAAWSYRINGGSWSGYDDRSVALYNLPKGQVTVELRVRSIISSTEEKNLTRKFTYDGTGSVLVPDPNSSGSAN